MWKKLVLGSLVTHCFIESYIDCRQLSILNDTKLPTQVEQLFEKTTVEQSSRYEKDRVRVRILRRCVRSLVSVIFIVLDLYNYFWDLSEVILHWLVLQGDSTILQAIICMNVLRGVELIASIPFELYETFIVEEKHGFNKSTLNKFWTDLIMLHTMGTSLSCLFTYGLLKIIQFGGDSFLIYAGLFLVVFYCFVHTIVPIIIFPWFYQLTPLDEGKLKTSIDELAGSLGFPNDKIYVCDGSTRSSHSNAFFTGLPWAKYIVIYDTLIESASVDEIVSILAHELGHWKNNDTAKLAALGIFDSLIGLYLFSLVYKTPSFYQDFGFFDSYPVYMGFVIFQHLCKIPDLLSKLTRNFSVRIIEYQADNFAVKLGYKDSLSNALTKLELKNLSATNTDWLYSIYSLSHPNLSERLNSMNVFDKDR